MNKRKRKKALKKSLFKLTHIWVSETFNVPDLKRISMGEIIYVGEQPEILRLK